MIKLCVSNTPVASGDILKSNIAEGIQLEHLEKSNIKNLSHSQDSLFETSPYFLVEDSLLTKADLTLIVEKELNSGLNGFEIKDNIIFGAADKRRNGLVLYN